jgi:predicted transcriptional regulator
MRTTVDLPEELLRQAQAIAHDTSRSFSQVVSELMNRGLTSSDARDHAIESSSRTGLPVIRIGHVITSDDVRRLEDDEIPEPTPS